MTLNGVMAVTLRYFTEFGKLALQKTICGAIYASVYCILVRVQCRRKESSRSLSHLLMSFLSVVLKCNNQVSKPRLNKSKSRIIFPRLQKICFNLESVVLATSISSFKRLLLSFEMNVGFEHFSVN